MQTVDTIAQSTAILDILAAFIVAVDDVVVLVQRQVVFANDGDGLILGRCRFLLRL